MPPSRTARRSRSPTSTPASSGSRRRATAPTRAASSARPGPRRAGR
jgi:hypothetical protein